MCRACKLRGPRNEVQEPNIDDGWVYRASLSSAGRQRGNNWTASNVQIEHVVKIFIPSGTFGILPSLHTCTSIHILRVLLLYCDVGYLPRSLYLAEGMVKNQHGHCCGHILQYVQRTCISRPYIYTGRSLRAESKRCLYVRRGLQVSHVCTCVRVLSVQLGSWNSPRPMRYYCCFLACRIYEYPKFAVKTTRSLCMEI